MSSDNGAAVLSRNGTAVSEPPVPHRSPPMVLAEARTVTEASVTVIAGPTVSDQVRQLMAQINQAPARSMSSRAQDEMARIVKLLPDLVAKNDPYLTDSAKLAVTGLLEGEPSVCFARSIRRNIEGQVARWRTPLRAMYRGRPPMRATLGLLVFAAAALVVSLLARATEELWPGLHAVAGVKGVDGKLLYSAAAMGAIGSIVSVFVRVPRMSADFREADPEVPFFVGLLKPMVGIAFAVFAYLAIEGGLLPLEVRAERAGAFYMAISFVAGFSERFVPDIITKAERHGAGTPTP